MSSAVSSNDEQATLPAPHEQKLLPAHASEAKGTTPPPRRSGWRLWATLLIIALLAAAAFWKIRSNKQETDAEAQKPNASDRPTPVQVATVQQKTMPIYLQALGTVTAYNTVTIRSRVDGQLLRVNFREGQAVRKGQLLLEIDPRPYQAALDLAAGQLARDKAQAAYAQAEAQRYQALYQAGVVSKESQQTQQSTAGQAQGTLQADQASVEAARVNLAYTRITSPIDGVVGLRQVDPGNIVHASDTTGLVVITQLQPISVIFTLPEDRLQEVLKSMRAGRRLPVEAWDRGNTRKLATGSLLTVDNQIDQTTGTDRLKAVFDNRDGLLFPNQFVNTRLVIENRPNALVIPAAALNSGADGSFVYVVRPGDPPQSLRGTANGSQQGGGAPAARRRAGGKGGASQQDAAAANQPHYWAQAMPVQVDTTEGTDVILTSGVKAGDQLVTDGQEKLKNGSRVVPRKGVTSTGVQSAVVRENGRQQGGSAPAGAPGDPANPGAILPDAPTAPNGSNMSGSAGHTTGGGSGSGSSQGQPQ